MTENLFLTVLDAGKSKVKALLPGSRWRLLAVSSHGGFI